MKSGFQKKKGRMDEMKKKEDYGWKMMNLWMNECANEINNDVDGKSKEWNGILEN